MSNHTDEEFEMMRKTFHMWQDTANRWEARALKAEAALAVAPAVGGETIKRVAAALNVVLLEYDYDFNDIFLGLLATRAIEAAQSASLLPGRNELSTVIKDAYFRGPVLDWGAVADAVLTFLSAALPEQTVAPNKEIPK